MSQSKINLSALKPRVRDFTGNNVKSSIDSGWKIQLKMLRGGLFLTNQNIDTINKISQLSPESKFVFDIPTVDQVILSNHLNGKPEYDNSPLFAINSWSSKLSYVNLSLIQCFYGQETSHVNSVKLALLFMSLSNPRPAEWIFVEAQRDESDAKFKWVSEIGIRYVFVKIQNDRQNYFIKEQLWNIGAFLSKQKNLVFVDGDVAYCQSNWLKIVDDSFNDGVRLFQPHAWSWKASELNGAKDDCVDCLNILQSFGYRHTNECDLCKYWGHTGYDIALTRELYNSIHGFYSLKGTGGDFLMWSLLRNVEIWETHPLRNIIAQILKENPIPTCEVGCSNLACFHNAHGNIDQRKLKYQEDNKRAETSKNAVANNFNSMQIGEI